MCTKDFRTGVEQACAALDMCVNSSDMEGAMYNADQTLIALRALLANTDPDATIPQGGR